MDYNDDDYYDEEYYDDVDSAADDWEEEAIEVEKKEEEEKRIREALLERQIATRAKKKIADDEKNDVVLPDEVEEELSRLRQEACGVAAGASFGEVEYIGNMPFATVEDAQNLGREIADHLSGQKDKENFKSMLSVFLNEIINDFSTIEGMNQAFNALNSTRSEVARLEKLEKRRGENKKKGETATVNTAADEPNTFM